MLLVSKLLQIARDTSLSQRVLAATPGRFTASGVPAVVVWNVVRHCNMSCPHCYAAATTTPSKHDLTTEQGLALLDQLAEAGVGIIIFSGGEPLLRSDLFELIDHAVHVGLAPQLSTNGVLITDSVAKELKSTGIEYVGVSIDGQAGFNDRYRGMVGGFSRATQALGHARDAGMRTGIRMTLTQKNRADLASMLELTRELNVNRFYLSHLLYSGRGFSISGDDLSPEECRETLHWLFAYADACLDDGSELGIVTGGNDSDGPLLLRWIEGRYGLASAEAVRQVMSARGGNSAGEKILNINHQGLVHPDQFWRQAKLGNVKEQSITEILAHPLRKQLRERQDHIHGRCSECAYQSLCRGSHRERALAKFDDMWASDPACVLTDAELREQPLSQQSAEEL